MLDSIRLKLGLKCPLYKRCPDYNPNSNTCLNDRGYPRDNEIIDCYECMRSQLKEQKTGLIGKVFEGFLEGEGAD